jgi:hypothetical protein
MAALITDFHLASLKDQISVVNYLLACRPGHLDVCPTSVIAQSLFGTVSLPPFKRNPNIQTVVLGPAGCAVLQSFVSLHNLDRHQQHQLLPVSLGVKSLHTLAAKSLKEAAALFSWPNIPPPKATRKLRASALSRAGVPLTVIGVSYLGHSVAAPKAVQNYLPVIPPNFSLELSKNLQLLADRPS